MVTRRDASAAGERWSKWEDPILYTDPTDPFARWLFVFLVWMLFIDFGLLAGIVVHKLSGG